MGDAADSLLSGLLCGICGELLDGREPGYPRTCEACGGGEERSPEARRAYKERTIKAKARRRRSAAGDYDAARALALLVDMRLIQHVPAHYSLRNTRQGEPDWVLNIWPGPRRIGNVDKGRGPAALPPFLGDRLRPGWTLTDVVQAAADALGRRPVDPDVWLYGG